MVPTSSSSKTLNALAPEYIPKTPVVSPDRPHAQPHFLLSPFLPSSCSASAHQFFRPPSSITSPSVFCHPSEFYLPTSPHPQQHFGDITTYSYISPGNPNSGYSVPPPPQAVVTADSSSTFQPEGVNTRTVSDRKPFAQVRQTRATPSGGFRGFRPGVRSGYLGRSGSWRRIEGRPESSRHVRKCVPNEENRHIVLSLKQDEENTTVMLKNIPYDCPREYLVELLDRFCTKCRNESASSDHPEEQINASYDFLYLPIDFKTGKGRGFAFFNFTNAAAAWKFFDTFDSTEWDPLVWNRWPKKMEIARAKIQGKEALITHFSNSTFECESDDFLPAYFSPPRDGSGHHVEMTSVGRRRAIPHWEPRGNHKA